jgi:hypothetical protein
LHFALLVHQPGSLVAGAQWCVPAQLQTSVPQVVPFAVQSVSFVHVDCAFARAVHVSEPAATTANDKAMAFSLMAISLRRS